MPRTARKVDSLAKEGEEMTDALTTVLDVAETEGTVTWSDVSDEMTSGQWGRLIETGLLVDAGGDGFVIDDPEGVREALEETDASVTDDADLSWTGYDKLAAISMLVMFLGYLRPGIRDAIGSTLNIVLGPIRTAMPFYLFVLVLATFTAIASALFQDNLANMEVMSEYQEKNEEIKQRLKDAKDRGDQEAVKQIQKEQREMMAENTGVFKAQFRPMVWIMATTIPVFLYIYWLVRAGTVEAALDTVMILPLIGEVSGWQEGIIGPFRAWIFWYMLCSISLGQIVRKAMNVQTTPG